MNIKYMLLILGSPEINNIVSITISIVKSAHYTAIMFK